MLVCPRTQRAIRARSAPTRRHRARPARATATARLAHPRAPAWQVTPATAPRASALLVLVRTVYLCWFASRQSRRESLNAHRWDASVVPSSRSSAQFARPGPTAALAPTAARRARLAAPVPPARLPAPARRALPFPAAAPPSAVPVSPGTSFAPHLCRCQAIRALNRVSLVWYLAHVLVRSQHVRPARTARPERRALVGNPLMASAVWLAHLAHHVVGPAAIRLPLGGTPVCAAGSYSAANASICQTCPSYSTSAANSSTCACNPGYSTSGSGASLVCTGTSVYAATDRCVLLWY